MTFVIHVIIEERNGFSIPKNDSAYSMIQSLEHLRFIYLLLESVGRSYQLCCRIMSLKYVMSVANYLSIYSACQRESPNQFNKTERT